MTKRNDAFGLKTSYESITFRKALLEAVDSGLQVLGESVSYVIYHHVERNSSLRREEIPDRLEDFHKGLESRFGAGARVIERIIADRLYSKLGLKFEELEGQTLVDYVNGAKKVKGSR